MGDISTNDDAISSLLHSIYALLKQGLFENAEKELEKALEIDFEHPEVIATLKTAHYWREKGTLLDRFDDAYAEGEWLFKEWGNFSSFIGPNGADAANGVYAVKQWVFRRALAKYLSLTAEAGGLDREILLRISKCYKSLGDYANAVEYIEGVSRVRRDDPEILAELADCYAFISETRAAKVFFREAFFIDPQRVQLESLESLLICRLIDRVRSMGHESPVLAEWIPVYGVIYGIFNVKRELRPLEYGRLKQTIFELENEVRERNNLEVTVPRLLNRYLWLIDHLVTLKDARDKIEEVLEKIKIVAPSIYELYTD